MTHIPDEKTFPIWDFSEPTPKLLEIETTVEDRIKMQKIALALVEYIEALAPSKL